ncbi:glycosyltransferase [Lactobacillus terrae]|uniref:glycosyltransferase n=1 Tax=Lactobacillus terrae TaxID=2269374 RepID=UPI000C1B7039|nr:glycosyltransferase family 2 protein [Lactobacillus terrae]
MGWVFIGFIILLLFCIGVLINKSGRESQLIYQDRKKAIKKKRFEYRLPKSQLVIFSIGEKIIDITTFTFIVGCLIYQVMKLSSGYSWTGPFIIISFGWMAFIILSACLNVEYKGNIPDLKKVVIIPVYNEDPKIVSEVLDSIINQTVPVDYIAVMEDGSDLQNNVSELVKQKAREANVNIYYKYIENSGKRVAQSHAFKRFMNYADVFITIDSDTILKEDAIEKGILPFNDDRVMSVGGTLLNYNSTNFLTKVTGLGFVSSFTNGRSAWSKWKAVAVNCGGLAFYRKDVINQFLDDYLNQEIFGEKVNFGDDRMLTQYASLLGDTVFQESSIGYTMLPEKFSHLTRQRVRWWKSFWWGGVWLLKNQKISEPVWWLTLTQYISFVLYSVILPFVLIIFPVLNQKIPFEVVFYVIILSYVRSIRTLKTNPLNMTKTRQFLEFLILAPLSTIINFYLCSMLQVYSLLTLRQSKNWGTRQSVELTLDPNGGN